VLVCGAPADVNVVIYDLYNFLIWFVLILCLCLFCHLKTLKEKSHSDCVITWEILSALGVCSSTVVKHTEYITLFTVFYSYTNSLDFIAKQMVQKLTCIWQSLYFLLFLCIFIIFKQKLKHILIPNDISIWKVLQWIHMMKKWPQPIVYLYSKYPYWIVVVLAIHYHYQPAHIVDEWYFCARLPTAHQ